MRDAQRELDRVTGQGAGIGGVSSPLQQLAAAMSDRRRSRRRGEAPAEDRAGFHGGGFVGAGSITGSVGSSLGFGGGVNPAARRTPPPPDAVPLRRRGADRAPKDEVYMGNAWHGDTGNGSGREAGEVGDDDQTRLLEDRVQLAEDRARLAEDRALVVEERMLALERRAQLVEERASHAEARARAAEEAVQKATDDAAELRQRIADAEARAKEAREEASKPKPKPRSPGRGTRPRATKPAPPRKSAAAAKPSRATTRRVETGAPAAVAAAPPPHDGGAPSDAGPRLGGVLGRRLAAGPQPADTAG
jgi:hypothetical protein